MIKKRRRSRKISRKSRDIRACGVNGIHNAFRVKFWSCTKNTSMQPGPGVRASVARRPEDPGQGPWGPEDPSGLEPSGPGRWVGRKPRGSQGLREAPRGPRGSSLPGTPGTP